MKPHPAAEAWPMLPDSELRELADSIRGVGLLEPLVSWVDKDTGEQFLLDGRNRLAACKLANVKPTTIVYDGDPIEFVLARNQHRRHMSSGQRAMAAWMTAASSGLSQIIAGKDLASNAAVPAPHITWAKTVAEHAPDLVANVTNGVRTLKDAYDEARQRRTDADSDESKLAELPDDLAGQVRDETLSLDEAVAANKARLQREADNQRDARTLLTRIVDLTVPSVGELDAVEWVTRLGPIADDDPTIITRLDTAIRTLTRIKKEITK